MNLPPQRIAIIGSGIAGMGAGFLLNQNHDITVYEKNDYIGGHARTREINYANKKIAVDTGFIVFNQRNYPHLTKLFRHLNVPSHKTSMSFGLTTEDGSLEWGAESLNAIFGQRSNLFNPTFYRFIRDVFKFNHRAVDEVQKNSMLTLGELVQRLNLGDWFPRYYILPIGGAIWSCPLETILSFPAKFFVDFFDAHGLLSVNNQPQWYTVTGGSQIYIDRLTQPFQHKIKTSCGAVRVTRANNKVQISDERGETTEFDQVVFACHAPETVALLGDATSAEQSLLGAFRHQKNVAILHKHSATMPRRRACWASWVYHAKSKPDFEPIMITYWMNKLQGIDNKYPLFVTLNPRDPIPDSAIFDRHVFYHPIYDPTAVAAQPRIADMQGQNNTWHCGAYQKYGFHEDGLGSAVDMAAHMGIGTPW